MPNSQTIQSSAYNAVFYNEASGTSAVALTISKPVPGSVNSGWTIGYIQEDFRTNSAAAQATLDKALTDSGAFSSSMAQEVGQALTAAAGSPTLNLNGIKTTSGAAATIANIDQALQTSSGEADIQASSLADFNNRFNSYLTPTIFQSPSLVPAVSQALSDPTYGPLLQIVLADYDNQFKLNTSGNLYQLLTTGSAQFAEGQTITLNTSSAQSVTVGIMDAIINQTQGINNPISACGRLDSDVMAATSYDIQQGAAPPPSITIDSPSITCTFNESSTSTSFNAVTSTMTGSGTAQDSGSGIVSNSYETTDNNANGTSTVDYYDTNQSYASAGSILQQIVDYSGSNGQGSVLSNLVYSAPTLSNGENVFYASNITIETGYGNTFISGSNINIDGQSGSTILTNANANYTVSGLGISVLMNTNSTSNFTNSGYSGSGLSNTVMTDGNTSNINIGYNGEATITGNGGTTNFTGSYATQYVDSAVEYVYSIAGVNHDVVYANNERLYISSSDQTTVVGNHDSISGSSGDDFAVYGDYDPVSGNDVDVDYYGNNYTGDTVSGSGDEYGDEGGDDGGGGDYGGYYGYALTATAAAAKTSGKNIGAIAANDLSMNDRIGAVGSQTARLQANAALAGSVGSGAVLEGPKWDSKVITWSLATDLGSANVPFTGTIGQQYDATIEGAFEQWAAASGLKFEEVSDSTSADIRLGWSSFDPTTSGVLGYTALKAKAGVAQADTLIGLENPTEDALVTDSNGQLAYSGTQTELSQLVLHEIGHALGLADDSDVNSIMYPTLSTANETLDSTDIAGIQSLYAPSTATSTLGDILAASGSALSATSLSAWSSFQSSASTLIDSMATFNPTPLSAADSPTLAQVAAVATVPPAWLAAQVSH